MLSALKALGLKVNPGYRKLEPVEWVLNIARGLPL